MVVTMSCINQLLLNVISVTVYCTLYSSIQLVLYVNKPSVQFSSVQ